LSSAVRNPKGSSVVPVCLDLNKPWFKDERFDLVVGRAILHHLFEPDLLISNVYRSLKSGGSIIFFEPYECGGAMFALLIELIVATSHRLPGISKDMREHLERMVLEHQSCEPKPIDQYANVDDKWNFTRAYFSRIADSLRAELKVYSLYGSSTPFSGELAFRLKAGIGAEKDALPSWVWELLDRWEKRISQDAKDDMSIAVGIIFTKPC
jgi:SAM-dependent methyltransferase